MSMVKLAMMNVKHGLKNYLSLILSLAFTVLVLFNFQNLIGADSFLVLGTRNKQYIEIIVQIISFILGCFMFFFIGYATNVFLTRRKKEIGIYIFMGLSHEKIGQLYLLETIFTGLAALILGLFFGALTCGLFQMILLLISDLSVEIRFRPGLRPALFTAAVYGMIYLFFAVKGYIHLLKSSVASMLSAAKQNEYIRQKRGTLWTKTVLGVWILGTGYFLALKEGRTDVMGNALGAVVLVTIGVYLLFGGFLPLLAREMVEHKSFLYRKQRILWVNRLVFRMKKNYRTYAMVCILLLCSVTALATSFAMKGRYDNIIRFENTYTFQLLIPEAYSAAMEKTAGDDLAKTDASDLEKTGLRDLETADLSDRAKQVIEENTELAYDTKIPVLFIDTSLIHAEDYANQYAVLPYSALKALSVEAGLAFDLPEPGDDQVIKVSHPVLLSLITDRTGAAMTINGKSYLQIEESTVPYLGYLQESIGFYVVNDKEYASLLPLGEEMLAANYKISYPEDFEHTKEALDGWRTLLGDSGIARVAIDPKSNELDWIKVMYSMGVFMFLVFVVASGSIMFMRLYNDAFEETERTKVLLKLGIDRGDLRRAVKAELAAAYGVPFLVMSVSSFFSVGALSKMMFVDLSGVNAVSLVIVLAVLIVWYRLSVWVYPVSL